MVLVMQRFQGPQQGGTLSSRPLPERMARLAICGSASGRASKIMSTTPMGLDTWVAEHAACRQSGKTLNPKPTLFHTKRRFHDPSSLSHCSSVAASLLQLLCPRQHHLGSSDETLMKQRRCLKDAREHGCLNHMMALYRLGSYHADAQETSHHGNAGGTAGYAPSRE